MRLIDADALLKSMFSYYACVNENTCKRNYNGETIMTYEVAELIEDCIENAPTIDAVPVVRGEWKNVYKSGYKPNPDNVCSECDCWSHRRSNFCPNCGAKMEVEP
jgi:hypothetical protein